jgi:hypothetical protein
MYVENVATSPGNQRTEIWCRQLKHVGLALLAYAAILSHEHGYMGFLGLHAADDDAHDWYKYLNRRYGGVFTEDTFEVSAPLPLGEGMKIRPYLETLPGRSDAILRDFYNG